MKIQSVQASEDSAIWQVTLTNSTINSVPQDAGNSDARMVQEWIVAGGVVDPYVPPAEPTVDDKLDRLGDVYVAFLKYFAKQTGRTMHEIRAGIKAEM